MLIKISMGHQNNKKLTKYTEKQNPNYPIKQTIACQNRVKIFH